MTETRKHPSLEAIALWILEPDSSELAAAARDHLVAGCPSCSQVAASLRRLADRILESRETAAPSDVTARARLVAEQATRSDTILIAELLRDTVELVGVRGESAGARYLHFRAGEYDLSVRIRPDARRKGRSELRLQLHAPETLSPAGVRVRVLRDRTVLGESVTDELGEVYIPHFSSPPCLLELVRGPLTIRTPRIQ